MLQPPTDNLYKFIAIFGLLLFGFSFYIPLQRLETYDKEVAKWNADWLPLLQRQRAIGYDLAVRADCAIDAASRAIKGKPAHVTHACKELAASEGEAKRVREQMDLAFAEHKKAKEILEHLRRQYLLYAQMAVATGFVGLALIVTGFWLWYVRVQKPLDMLNRRAATPPPN